VIAGKSMLMYSLSDGPVFATHYNGAGKQNLDSTAHTGGPKDIEDPMAPFMGMQMERLGTFPWLNAIVVTFDQSVQ
jgi:hypothetical protein